MLDSIMKKLKRGVSSHAMGGTVPFAKDTHAGHDHHGGCCGHDHGHGHDHSHHHHEEENEEACSTKPGKGGCC